MKVFAVFVICSSLAFVSFTNKECACCTPEYRQFDFWLGDWNVYDAEGKKVGENHVLERESGCIIQENWTSENMTGSSYNYFNTEDKTWNQLWLDDHGSNLILKGTLVDGNMVMKSTVSTDKEGNKVYNQISWEPKPDGSVIQLWEVFLEDGTLQQELFKGIYRKKSASGK